MPAFKVIWSVKKYLDTIPAQEGVEERTNAENFAEENPDSYVINDKQYYSEFYVWIKNGKSEEDVIENLKPKNSVMLEIYKISDSEAEEIPLLNEFVKRQQLSRPDRESVE